MTHLPFSGRVSIRKEDSGYPQHEYARGKGFRTIVKFNGEMQIGVVTADSEAGMIVRYKRDAAGQYEYDKARQCLVDEVCHGRVEIEYQPEVML